MDGCIAGASGFHIMALFEKDRALKSRSYTHCLGAMAGTGAFGAMLGAIVALVISSYSPMVEQLVDYKIVVPALDSNATICADFDAPLLRPSELLHQIWLRRSCFLVGKETGGDTVPVRIEAMPRYRQPEPRARAPQPGERP